MPNWNEIAEEMVDRCPLCGGDCIRVLSAEITDVRCGFLLMNTAQVLRVNILCAHCDQNASVFDGGGYQHVDLNPETVASYLQIRKHEAKKRRKLYGLD